MPGAAPDAAACAPGCAAGQAYAGIGSREAPPAAIELIESVARTLARRGCVLRTGASPGADQAFYRAAADTGGEIELYLPWPGFEADSWAGADPARVHVQGRPTPQACELAAHFHAGWEGLAEPQRLLLARDAHQVLGADLKSPAALVVCWTADGSRDGSQGTAEGTHQALRIAARHGVPVRNLARAEDARAVAALAAPEGQDG